MERYSLREAMAPGTYVTIAELYDPATGLFTQTGSLNTARYSDTATLLNNGMVLIAGGLGSSDYLASAELYRPYDWDLHHHRQPEHRTRQCTRRRC